MNAIAIIPARYDSSRFPGKPLADRTGKPMIQHVVEQVRRAERVVRIIVATDDQRIAKATQDFGSEAMMTRPDHPNGTSRIAEVVEQLLEADDYENTPPIVVNVQADEPEIDPGVIDKLIAALDDEPHISMATIASEFAPYEKPTDPNIVKVVVNQRGRALYFSRSVIPFNRDGALNISPLKHVGIYAYRPDFLIEYARLRPTPLEQIEQLEQLRALESGHPILVVHTNVSHHGIDTPQQYDAFVKRYNERADS
jgi:3-deoxy-manno-octulosonate cytidylyltransferase (CMP-KDO synthetase)